MKRLRYQKQEDGTLIALVITTHEIIKVTIQASDKCVGSKLEGEKGDVKFSGEHTSTHKAKKAVKTWLIYLGAQFLDEVRKPRKQGEVL